MTAGTVRAAALGLVLLLGIGVRLFLLLRWPRRLNVDESTVGLMGLQILRGDFPVFFSGQGYMGAPEAYLSAVVYALLGASPLTAKLAVFAASCALVGVHFALGNRLGGWPAGLAAALLTALAPPFLPLFGNYPMLGYTEVVVVGSLVLLTTLALLTDDSAPRRTRRLLGLGLLAGLAWWVNPMSLSYLGAAGLVLLLRPAAWLPAGLWAVPLGFFGGSLPFWLFNLTHDFWSFTLFGRGTEGALAAAPERLAQPLLEIAGVRGTLTEPVPVLSAAAGIVSLGCLAVVLMELARPSREAGGRARRWGIGLLLVFAVLHALAFGLSGYPGVQRYLFPLYSALPVLAAVALLRLAAWSQLVAAGAVAVLLLNNGLALTKTVRVFDEGLRRDWWTPEPVLAFLEAEGLARAYAEVRIAPRLTFEAQERVVVVSLFHERHPPYLRWVEAAPRVAYVVSDRGDELGTAQFERLIQGIGLGYRRRDLGAFAVFYDFRPPTATPLASLRPDGWRARSDPAGSDVARAFDRDVDTAWMSEAPMRPGMWWALDLGRVHEIGGVTVLPPRPWIGMPRGYRVELSRDGAAWETVAAVPEFVATVRWQDGQPRLERSGRLMSRFVPRPVRHVRLVQTGEHPREWWAIAEVFVHGSAAAPVSPAPAALRRLDEGLRHERGGRLDLALASYEQAVVLAPEWEAAHRQIAQTYGKAGLPVEGSDSLRRALGFEGLGQWRRAAREYEHLLAREDPARGEHSALLARLATVYRRLGEEAGARQMEARLRRDFTPPTPAEARFGRAVRLLGYDLAPRAVRAGAEVALAYYWQALGPVGEDLVVFVHFVQDGRVRFQQDHEPLEGRYSTGRWRPAELVRENYRVRVPRDAPPGEYEIRIGLWNPRTGSRLPVESALPRSGDGVALATLRVLTPE